MAVRQMFQFDVSIKDEIILNNSTACFVFFTPHMTVVSID